MSELIITPPFARYLGVFANSYKYLQCMNAFKAFTSGLLCFLSMRHFFHSSSAINIILKCVVLFLSFFPIYLQFYNLVHFEFTYQTNCYKVLTEVNWTRSELTCLVHNRVRMGFHTILHVPNKARKCISQCFVQVCSVCCTSQVSEIYWTYLKMFWWQKQNLLNTCKGRGVIKRLQTKEIPLLEIMRAGMFGGTWTAIKPFQGKRKKVALLSKPHILLDQIVLLSEHLALNPY